LPRESRFAAERQVRRTVERVADVLRRERNAEISIDDVGASAYRIIIPDVADDFRGRPKGKRNTTASRVIADVRVACRVV
jgi:hypothetical protein